MKQKLLLILICLWGISNLNGQSQSFPRKVVVEEGTGTWCGWCVRGAVGMEMMKEKYPDTFIGIAVHNNDPMTIMAYDNFMSSNFINYFPCAVVDRKNDLIGDPYNAAPHFFQSEMAQTPIAGIKLSGGFTDSNKNKISLKTETTFGISSNNANFKLVYVLIENGVTGYDQANYYSGGGSGAMGGYENKPNPVKDMVFNDVARGIYSDPTGIPGSIPASVTAMTPVENTYTINLPNSIQNKDQLAVAVMLINSATGEIENADIIGIGIIGQGIPVTGVKLNQTAATMIPGNTLQLTATVSPTYATNKKVTWSSSNQTTASVDDTGKVTALAAGTATITATTEDGKKTATCTIEVISVIAPCDNPIASGTTGDLIWTLCTDGTLTIIGLKEMPDYNDNGQPWNLYNTYIKSVVIEDGVKNIGNNAFYNCTNLTSVTIPHSVTAIGNSAFFYCTGLKSVTIGNSVTAIGNLAFANCTGLSSVTIPNNSVISIGTGAFANCIGLRSITIPNSVTSIGIRSFSGCFNLTGFEVDNANPSYTSENGVIFEKGKKKLICFPGGKSDSYDIPASVTSIGNYAFYNCASLKFVNIPGSVTSIEDWAFAFCSGLTSVSIGNSVTSIGDYAFYSCSGLTSVVCYAVMPPGLYGNSYTFEGVNLPNCVLYIPIGSKALYELAKGWKDFGSILERIPTEIVLPQTSAAVNVYVSNQHLYIESNVSETIDIYTVSGFKIRNIAKTPGLISVSCDQLSKGILIVKGSSGWVKKVLYSKNNY